jgi:hypothetical protein
MALKNLNDYGMSNFLEKLSVTQKRWLVHIAISIPTGGAWLLVAIFIELYRHSKAKKSSMELEGAFKTLENAIGRNEYEKAEIERKAGLLVGKIGKNQDLQAITYLEIPSVSLKESREGASHTSTSGTFESKTKTGTIGVSLTQNIGIAASEGKTKGTIQQQSVTTRGKDQITTVDTGKLVVTGTSVTFVGNLFTRTSTYDSILDYKSQGSDLRISSNNYDKAWVVQCHSDSDARWAQSLIEILKKGVGDASHLRHEVEALFKLEVERISKAIETAERQIEQLRADQGQLN